MSVTPETSHSPISPCGPLEQSPSGDSSRHALNAPQSSSLDCGENAAGQSSRDHCQILRKIERKDGNARVKVYMCIWQGLCEGDFEYVYELLFGLWWESCGGWGQSSMAVVFVKLGRYSKRMQRKGPRSYLIRQGSCDAEINQKLGMYI